VNIPVIGNPSSKEQEQHSTQPLHDHSAVTLLQYL
jgi:hypothetical protein